MPTTTLEAIPGRGLDGIDIPLQKIIRIVVVEDNRLLREGIVQLLREHPDLEVVGSAACADTALPTIWEGSPQVVLVDSGLGDDDSEALVERIAREAPGVAVVVMDILPERLVITGFLEAGASGFVTKDATTSEVLSVIRAVAAGGCVVPDRKSGSLLDQIARQAATRPLGGVMRSVIMTKRERRIIALISEGVSNREIARQLRIGKSAVRNSVRRIVEKLALRASLQSEIDFPS